MGHIEDHPVKVGRAAPAPRVQWMGLAVGGGHAIPIIVALAGPAMILIDTFHTGGRFSLTTWRNVFQDWNRWQALLVNTGTAAGTAVALSIVLGCILAVAVFKLDLDCGKVPAVNRVVRVRPLAAGALLLTAGVPVFVVNGALLSAIPIELVRYSSAAVGLIHGMAHVPLAVVIIGLALRMVPAEVEESALADGAGTVRTILRVTLPMASGGIVAAAILAILWTSTDYSVSDVLIVRTFAEEVYTQYALQGRPEEPALVAVPQMIAFAALLWALRKVYLMNLEQPARLGRPFLFSVGRARPAVSLAAGETRSTTGRVHRVRVPHPLRSKGWGIDPTRLSLSILTLGATFGLLAFVIISIARLVPRSEAFDLATGFRPEISVSLITSVLGGVVSALVAIGPAWFIVRRPRWRPLLIAYVIAVIAIPAPVLGMGLIRLLNRPGPLGWLYDSPAVLVVAYMVRFLPIAIMLLIPAVRSMARDCEDAARVDGAGEAGILYRIVAPYCFPTMLLAAFIVTILSIGELPCSVLLTPPGYVTVATRYFSLVHYGMYPDAAMLCLLSVAGVALPGIGVYLLVRRRLVS